MSDEPDLLAVTAHALLNPVSVISMAAALLDQRWDDIEPHTRREHLQLIREQTNLVAGVLGDLVRGLPPEVRELLDSLR